MGKDDCPGGHDCRDEGHLCKIAKRENDLNRLRDLVRGAQFLCRKCGRSAREASNLCKPEKI